MECGAPLPGRAPPRQTRKVVTVLFCDVVGSTALGERLDPEVVRDVMQRYYTAMCVAVERRGGVVGPLLGDGVMGVFGVPLAREDDAWRAVQAAVELRHSLDGLNDRFAEALGVRLRTRTGVATGEVLVGGYAFSAQVSGGVVGDCVNLAARLQAAAEPGAILLGDLTFRLTRERVRADRTELDVKGKAGPVVAYRFRGLIAAGEDRGRRLVAGMVGREHELRTALTAFEDALALRSAVLLTVIADAGLGKSRLVRELKMAVERRAQVLSGRCLPYGEGTTYWPFAEVACQAAGTAVDAPPEETIAALAALIQDDADGSGEAIAARLVGFLGLGPPAAPGDEGLRDLTLLIRALARRRPLMLVIEDVYFAKPALLDALARLAGELRDVPLLLVCTARRELLTDHPGWRQALAEERTIELTELPRLACERFVRALLGHGPAVDELIDPVYEASDGNPLVVEELLGMLIDDEAIQQTETGWTLTQPLTQLRIPPTIGAILQARLDLLPEQDRELLECAAIVGKEFLHSELRAIVDVNDLDGTVGSLLTRQLITIDERRFDHGYRFHHLLVRDAAYTGTAKRSRAALHERYAQHLEHTQAAERAGVYGEIIATHLEHAWQLRQELGASREELSTLGHRAATRFAMAAETAFDLSDWLAARSLYRRGAELVPENTAIRARLLIGLADVAFDLGETTETKALYQRAIATAQTAGARVVEVRARLNLLRTEVMIGERDADDASSKAGEAVSQLESHADGRTLARALIGLSEICGFAGRYDDAVDACERALQEARRASDVMLPYYLVGYCYHAFFGSIPTVELLEISERALAEAEPGTQHHWLLELQRARFLAMSGAAGIARDRMAAVIDEFESRRVAHWSAFANYFLGQSELWTGAWKEAERRFDAAARIWSDQGFHNNAALASACRAEVLARLGSIEAAEAAARDVSAAGYSDVEVQVRWRLALALAASCKSDFVTAEGIARQALDLASRTQCPMYQGDSLACLGEILRDEGRPGEAVEVINCAIRCYQDKGIVPLMTSARNLLATTLAVTA
jgi:class 3 adenylate cyclase/tetratricopeptide (TPR) repeat protein